MIKVYRDNFLADYTHPISLFVYEDFLSDLMNSLGGEDIILEMSHYLYRPMSILDDRSVFKVNLKSLDQTWLSNELNSLMGTPLELAVHSKVSLVKMQNGLYGRKKRQPAMHIPLIDLSADLSFDSWDVFINLMKYWSIRKMYIYRSGRSYHAYIPTVINGLDWPALMGSLLLCNERGKCDIVDCRWVGHRLMGGYSALRWSRNTKHYLDFPRYFRTIELES